MLDASKNGINDFVFSLLKKIPFVGHLASMSEQGDKYAQGTRREQDLIFDPNATAGDFAQAQQDRQEGLYGMLHEAKETIRTAPCTSINIDCGLSDFLPQSIQDAQSIFKNPLVFLTKKFFDKAIFDPAWNIPDLYLKQQLGLNGYFSGGGYGGGGGGSWGGPPSQGK